MLGLPALVAGLILDLAGSHWFSGAETVGLILIVIGGLICAVQIIILVLAMWAAGSHL